MIYWNGKNITGVLRIVVMRWTRPIVFYDPEKFLDSKHWMSSTPIVVDFQCDSGQVWMTICKNCGERMKHSGDIMDSGKYAYKPDIVDLIIRLTNENYDVDV